MIDFLIDLFNENKIEINLIYNSVTYDSDFNFNSQTGILTANSTTFPNESFGSNEKTLLEYLNSGEIKLIIKIKE